MRIEIQPMSRQRWLLQLSSMRPRLTAGGRLAASRSEAINDSLTPPTTEFSNERISSSRTSQNVGEKRGMIPPPRFNPCAYATEFPPGWRTVQLHSHVRARTREVNEVTRRWRDARDSFTRCIALRERQTKSPGYPFPRWKFQRDAWNGDFALILPADINRWIKIDITFEIQ